MSNNNGNNSNQREMFSKVVLEWADKQKLTKSFSNNSPTRTATTSLPTVVEEQIDHTTLDDLKLEIGKLKGKQDKFIYACKHGSDSVSLEMLTALVHDDSHYNLAKVKDKQSTNCSLLHICASLNKVQCLEFLVNHKIPVDILDGISATPLMYAVSHNREEAVGFLLSRKANVNTKDTYNKFPLLIALRNRNYKIAEFLVNDSRTDVHLRGTKGNTVLHNMIDEGDLASVQFLVEKCHVSPLRRNYDEQNALFCSLAYPEITQYLASRFSKDGLQKMIIAEDTYGRNVLHECCSKGYFDSWLFIIKSLYVNEMTSDQVSELLNSSDKSGDTPLLMAVKHQRLDMVRFLAKCSDVDVNEGDRLGNTALHYAMAAKNEKMISALTEIGASLKADTEDDQSEASRSGGIFYMDCIRSLTTVLIILLSTVAIVCTAVIAAISLGFFGSNIAQQSDHLREKYFVEVVNYVRSTVKQHNLISVTAFAEPRVNISDPRDIMQYTWGIFASNYKKAELATGWYCGVHDEIQAGVQVTPDLAAAAAFESYRQPGLFDLWDIDTQSIVPGTQIPVNDSRYSSSSTAGIIYPFVTAARNSPNIQWTLSYATPAFPDYLYITLVFPSWTNGAFTSFCASDSATAALTKFLQSSDQTSIGDIAIIERQTGYILATSDSEEEIFRMDGNDFIRYDGTKAKNKRIGTMIRFVNSNYGGLGGPKVDNSSLHYDRLRINSKLHAINTAIIQDEYGLDWLVIQALEMSTFYSKFFTSLGIILGVTVALLILSIVVSAVAAILFMRPMKELIRHADNIKILNLEQAEKGLEETLSYYTEIRSLQQAFQSMTKRLKQFRSFIPDHILSVLEAERNRDITNVYASHSKEVALNESDSDSRKSSISSTFHYSNGLVNQALSSGLTSGSVTIMTINFPNMVDIFEIHSANDVNEASKGLLTEVKNCIRSTNGQLVSIDCQKAVIAWNTFISQSDHRIRACKAAKNCMETVQKLCEQWKSDHLPAMNITIGIASGTAFFGNLGDSTMKFFTVIGKPAIRSQAICDLNTTWNTQILCSDDIAESAKDDFHFRPITRVNHTALIYEIGSSRNADEWAIELQDQNDIPWKQFNEAYKLYDKGQLEEARLLFMKHRESHPSDSVTQKLIDECNLRIEDETESTSMNIGETPRSFDDKANSTLNET